MMTAFGGSAQAVQEWGAQMASSSLNHAGSTNPILWIPGSIGATIGAAAYYLGWALRPRSLKHAFQLIPGRRAPAIDNGSALFYES